jgi:hypothetical protein
MKAFVFSATVWAIAIVTVPGAYACSESTGEVSPQHTGPRNDDKPVASETGLGVLVGLLLGLAVADPVAADKPCAGCTDAR